MPGLKGARRYEAHAASRYDSPGFPQFSNMSAGDGPKYHSDVRGLEFPTPVAIEFLRVRDRTRGAKAMSRVKK